jgi:hypothetical protein
MTGVLLFAALLASILLVNILTLVIAIRNLRSSWNTTSRSFGG